MVSHEDTRKKRMNEIKDILLEAFENDKQINKERLIARCCFDWGSARRKILEHIKIIELSVDFALPWEKK